MQQKKYKCDLKFILNRYISCRIVNNVTLQAHRTMTASGESTLGFYFQLSDLITGPHCLSVQDVSDMSISMPVVVY